VKILMLKLRCPRFAFDAWGNGAAACIAKDSYVEVESELFWAHSLAGKVFYANAAKGVLDGQRSGGKCADDPVERVCHRSCAS